MNNFWMQYYDLHTLKQIFLGFAFHSGKKWSNSKIILGAMLGWANK